ncbi:MAG: protein kinase [Planctomycetes bacterium]|nr:protein kinase [Planctomycetota bacterium]
MSRSDVDPSGPADDPVEMLLGECLLRWESDGEAALDELCRAHPEHAAALRQAVGLLRAAGLTPDAAPLPERFGEFRLLARLGGGGMGQLFVAEQEPLGRRVALKLIRPELAWFQSNRDRFRREAEAIARLQHPAIVPLYAWGEAGGVPYFAMELVEGCSLAAALAELAGRAPVGLVGDDLAVAVAARAGQPCALPWPLRGGWADVVCRVVAEVGAALQHAHDRGVLHRDVKPSNVMLGTDGRVRLVDFGLARTDGDAALTRSGTPLGSLAYMSPEQLQGRRDVDGRTDVYGLGLLLHELLSLRRAFAGDAAGDLQQAILAGRRPPLPLQHDATWRDLETVVARATALEPEHRYAGVQQLLADVAAVREGRPIAARRAGAGERLRRAVRRHPARAALCAALVVLVPTAAVLATLWWQERASGRVGRSYEARVAAARAVTAAFFTYRSGARADAVRGFDAILADDPEHDLALLGRLLCALSADDADDLERVLAQHAALAARHPMLGWFAVEAANLRGDADAARQRGALLPAEPPAAALDWFVQGVLELWRARGGDAARATVALRAIEQAILLDRSEVRTPVFHVYAAETAALCGDDDTAVRAARAIETLWPDSALAIASAGRALVTADGARSVQLLQRARDLAPATAVLHLWLAEGLMLQSRTDEAAAAYEAALARDDRLGSAWGGLALLHLGQGQFDAALRCSERYVAVEPNLGLAWRVRAQTLHLAQRWADARIAYAEAVQRLPDDRVVHQGCVAVLEKLGDAAAAAAERDRFAARR